MYLAGVTEQSFLALLWSAVVMFSQSVVGDDGTSALQSITSEESVSLAVSIIHSSPWGDAFSFHMPPRSFSQLVIPMLAHGTDHREVCRWHLHARENKEQRCHLLSRKPRAVILDGDGRDECEMIYGFTLPTSGERSIGHDHPARPIKMLCQTQEARLDGDSAPGFCRVTYRYSTHILLDRAA